MKPNLSGLPTASPQPGWSRFTRGLLAVAILQPALLGAAFVLLPARGEPPAVLASPVAHFPPSNLAFHRQTLGPEPGFRPQITNVKIVDLDQDGRPDVIVCDGQRNRVFWYRQLPDNRWEEVPLGDEVNCPAC